MKKYLYYPNMEPPNTKWLKFATLYLDRFESIVPYNRQYLVSDDYRKLANETDLVELYSPEYHQGERATINAIEEAEKFLSRTYLRSPLFDRVNVFRHWQNPNTWNYQIYGEKFSNHWANFCESNGIGIRNDDGILLPRNLAFLYMTHLAKEIALEREGNIITDNVDYNNYTSFWKVKSIDSHSRNKFMKGIIDLKLPRNIEDISFDELIKFRNKNRENILAFNNQIDKVEESISNGLTEESFVQSFNDIYAELSKDVVSLGLGVLSIPFSLYVLINSPQALTEEYMALALGTLSIGVDGFFGVRKSLYDKKEERLCRKYFANLSRL